MGDGDDFGAFDGYSPNCSLSSLSSNGADDDLMLIAVQPEPRYPVR